MPLRCSFCDVTYSGIYHECPNRKLWVRYRMWCFNKFRVRKMRPMRALKQIVDDKDQIGKLIEELEAKRVETWYKRFNIR